MADVSLRVIKPLMRLGGAIAPGLAGRAAFRLLCTPPRRPAEGSTAGRSLAAARARLADTTRQAVTYPCGSVATYLFEPAGGLQAGGAARTVVLLHGWGSEAAFMTGFARSLAGRGLRVVALDLPAHGASSGAELSIPLGVGALASVARAFGPLHGVVAHSFGGAVALAALAGAVAVVPRLEAQRLALIAMPASVTALTRDFGRTVGLGKRGQAALERHIHTVSGSPITAFHGPAQLRAIGRPTLVVHDRRDREVPFSDAEALAGAGGFVFLHATSGLGHRRILQSRETAERIADFIAGGEDGTRTPLAVFAAG